MATQIAVSDTTRHVVRDVAVLAVSLVLTAAAVSGLAVLVGQWA